MQNIGAPMKEKCNRNEKDMNTGGNGYAGYLHEFENRGSSGYVPEH